MGDLDPSNLSFLGPFRVYNPNGIIIGSDFFAQETAECLYSLQWAPIYPKVAPYHGASGPPSNTWFPGPTRVLNQNGMSIGSAVFAQITAECPYGTLLSPQNCPFPWADLNPHLIHGLLGPKSSTKRHLDRFSRFCRAR